jgi:hypothetical protein
MAENGIWWRSCYACSGKLYELVSGALFCSNEHCRRGGRIMSFDETVDKPGAAKSSCILEDCLTHRKGKYENDGTGNDEAWELAVQPASPKAARKIRLRKPAQGDDRV